LFVPNQYEVAQSLLIVSKQRSSRRHMIRFPHEKYKAGAVGLIEMAPRSLVASAWHDCGNLKNAASAGEGLAGKRRLFLALDRTTGSANYGWSPAFGRTQV
jgi:hypothetical protein